VPGAPIRAVRRDRMMGYAAVVVIEQQVDSSSVIELVERRAATANLDAVVVTSAGETRAPDSVTQLKEERRKAEPRADAPAARLNARSRPSTRRAHPCGASATWKFTSRARCRPIPCGSCCSWFSR